MAAIIRLKDQNFSLSEFVELSDENLNFQGLKAGQEFIRFWLENKQNFGQKSSGSTGKPTVHQISREAIVASALRTVSTLGIPSGINALVCINMEYIGGKMMLARGLMNNWNLWLVPPAGNPMQDIQEGVTIDFAAMVPIQIEQMLRTTKGIEQLNGIKQVIVGGAAVSPALHKALQNISCEVYATYGMTETVSHVALQKLNGADQSGAFKMLEGIDFRQDERGCLRLRADVTGHEWVQTNDIVSLEKNRHFRVLGRADNVINTGGVKVQTEVLEATILATGLLQNKAFAITSMPDQTLGEKVVLVIEGSHDSHDRLLQALKPLLPEYHVPKSVLFIEQLPRTASDKIDRPQLKSMIGQNRLSTKGD